jgi:hypothetical protein
MTYDELIIEITAVLIDGLTTDGAHHKQWALEEALRIIAQDEFAVLKASLEWDDGVPP